MVKNRKTLIDRYSTTSLSGEITMDNKNIGLKSIKAAGPITPHALYLTVLAWTFTAFNSIRVLAYLPTLHAIIASGDSSQHSLLTWITFLGANATMAGWLYEQNGQRLGKAVLVNIGNATMCLSITVAIIWHRL